MPSPREGEPRRECGSCTLCCKSSGVYELDKPPGRWCGHCEPGYGCMIYGARPHTCKVFECGWKLGLGRLEDRPDRVRGFISWMSEREEGKPIILIFTEADVGAAHRLENVALIQVLLRGGFWVVVQHPNRQRTAVFSDGSAKRLPHDSVTWADEMEAWRAGKPVETAPMLLEGPSLKRLP